MLSYNIHYLVQLPQTGGRSGVSQLRAYGRLDSHMVQQRGQVFASVLCLFPFPLSPPRLFSPLRFFSHSRRCLAGVVFLFALPSDDSYSPSQVIHWPSPIRTFIRLFVCTYICFRLTALQHSFVCSCVHIYASAYWFMYILVFMRSYVYVAV